MECKYFGECGSCTLYELSYEEQLSYKKDEIKSLFEDFGVKDVSVFPSEPIHYRTRGEFRIWHDESGMHYGMNQAGEKRGVVCIEECPKVLKPIYDVMEPLRSAIKKKPLLKEKLFTVEFLAAKSGVLVSLLYHKPLDEKWCKEAKLLQDELGINIIGRSRKIKHVLGEDFLKESLLIRDKEYYYNIYENAFSQPNPRVNEQMISWALKSIKEPKDLLELYCGHGNFTIPFAEHFNRVLATEISKSSIKAAKENCTLNGVENIEFLRMSVEELTSALKKEREFKRLREINLDEYDFSHVFVDPPRAGIDEKSLEFISNFETIVYISCNPLTLKRDLEFLKEKYEVKEFALFDQFPYTKHMEAGAILKRKEKI